MVGLGCFGQTYRSALRRFATQRDVTTHRTHQTKVDLPRAQRPLEQLLGLYRAQVRAELALAMREIDALRLDSCKLDGLWLA